MADSLKSGAACISGAASGIGRATALAFARNGCRKLCLGDLSKEGLDETSRIITESYPDATVVTCKVDVSQEKDVHEYHALAVQTFGRIDFAANVAGYGHSPIVSTELDMNEYDKCMNVNLTGVFLCERAQIRQMLKQEPLAETECRGSIVNVGSICGSIAMPGMTGYSMTKGGVLGQTRTDALDYGEQGIRVNFVGPGNVVTPMLKNVMGKQHMDLMIGLTPLGRLGRPDDIANAVAWAISPLASYLTGVYLPVDGGLSLRNGPF